MIEVSKATIVFGVGSERLEAVRDVSFSVARGEVFGLVGESGCGKSTLLRAIAGLLPLASGSIALAGREVGIRRTQEERRLVQMVFQDPYASLNPTHTVDKILAEPLAIQGLDDDRPAHRAGALRGRHGGRSTATAIRTRSPAASASASPSPGR